MWGFATFMLHFATGQLLYQGLTQRQLVSVMLRRRPPEVSSRLPEWLPCALGWIPTIDTAAWPSAALHKVYHTSHSTVFIVRSFVAGLQHVVKT